MFHKPGDTITDNTSPNQVIIPYNTDLTNIGTGLTIEDIKTTNPYLGIDAFYNLDVNDNFRVPAEGSEDKIFQYFKRFDPNNNLIQSGVLVQTNHNIYKDCFFQLDKANGTIDLGLIYAIDLTSQINYQTTTTIKGNINVLKFSGLYLSNRKGGSTTIIPHANDISFKRSYITPNNTADIVIFNTLRFTHQTNNLVIQKPGEVDGGAGKITITYGTDLTNLESRLTTLESGSGSNDLITFRESIIDNIVMANAYGNLYDKITDSQKYPITIKTVVNDNIYPRITNMIFTLYYSSYIDTVQGTNTNLLDYYTDNSETAYAVITISVSTTPTPQLVFSIKYTGSNEYKKYVVIQDTPKVTVDVTADLAAAGPGKKLHFLTLGNLIPPG